MSTAATATVNTLAHRREAALRRCREQIAWYTKHSLQAWFASNGSQSAAIILGGLTPILILFGDAVVSKPLQALPAAVAAMISAINVIFKWREDGVRFADAKEALKSELVKYETRTTEPYKASLSEEKALNNFVERIEMIAMGEVAAWRAQRLTDATEPNNPPSPPVS